LLEPPREDEKVSAGCKGEKKVQDGGVEGERRRGKNLVRARGAKLAFDVAYVGQDGGGSDIDGFGLAAGRAGGCDDVGSGMAVFVPADISGTAQSACDFNTSHGCERKRVFMTNTTKQFLFCTVPYRSK
jgi:hypothetical protein